MGRGGAGSFFMFWVSYFIQVKHNPAFRLNVIDYMFIGTMAGISSFAALLAKKADIAIDNSEDDDTPPKPPAPPAPKPPAPAPAPPVAPQPPVTPSQVQVIVTGSHGPTGASEANQ